MKSMKIAGLCLVALFLVSMAMTETASAAPVWESCIEGAPGTKYTAEHEQCEEGSSTGKWGWAEIKGTEKAIGVGSLRFHDETIVPWEVECTAKIEGSLGPGKYSRLEKATYECKAGENCEKFEKIENKSLPWQEELYETEGKTHLKITSVKGEKEPVVVSVTCKVLGMLSTDEANIGIETPTVTNARTWRLLFWFELLVLTDPSNPLSRKGSLPWLGAKGNGIRVS